MEILKKYRNEYQLILNGGKYFIYRPIYKKIQFVFDNKEDAIKKYNSMLNFEQNVGF